MAKGKSKGGDRKKQVSGPEAQTDTDAALPSVDEWAAEAETDSFGVEAELPDVAEEPQRRHKTRRKDLKRKIRQLEAEVAEAQRRITEEPLYGLTPRLEAAVIRALAQDRTEIMARLLRPLHSADIADLVERLIAGDRAKLLLAIGEQFDAQVLAYLDENVREEVIGLLGEDQIADAVRTLDSDDAVELMGELDDDEQDRILAALPAKDREILEEGLTYPDSSAGRLMQREMVIVPEHWTVGQTIDFLRTVRALPDDFYDIFVVDPEHQPVGELALSHLLRSKRPVLVSDIMRKNFKKVQVLMDQEEVANLFRQYGLVAAPVVDDDDKLLGIITVDDVVDVIDEEASEDLLALAGVKEVDLYDSMWDTTKSRFPWLVINLATAVAASMVIGVFEATIEKIVALAVLMPIVASMGGNAGTQTLTVAVRALAMRDLDTRNAAKFIFKESVVGSLNGLAFALLVAVVSIIWFGDMDIAIIIAVAMVVNMLVAALAGTLIPLGLDRFKIDPAVASGVFLTTVTDVVGFFTFLGLAALVLL